jgi:hypothetical protein
MLFFGNLCYAVKMTAAFDRAYRFSSEASIWTEQPLLTLCRSELLSWVKDNCEFPDAQLATLAGTESLYTTEINFSLQKVNHIGESWSIDQV